LSLFVSVNAPHFISSTDLRRLSRSFFSRGARSGFPGALSTNGSPSCCFSPYTGASYWLKAQTPAYNSQSEGPAAASTVLFPSRATRRATRAASERPLARLPMRLLRRPERGGEAPPAV
jgi:hypothetical protein